MDGVGIHSGNRWASRRERKRARLQRAANYCIGRFIQNASVVEAIEALLCPGDRVCVEGNNQKQADYLSRALAKVDPTRIYDLHLVISVLGRPEHMELFEKGIASRVDFSFSGPQALRLAQMVADGRVQIGAIHTYLELFARYFVDLPLDVAFVAGDAADEDGNVYTSSNTEETPLIVEAAAFHNGLVIVQVNEVLKTLPGRYPGLVG